MRAHTVTHLAYPIMNMFDLIAQGSLVPLSSIINKLNESYIDSASDYISNNFNMNIMDPSLEYSIMCEWVIGFRNHGPPKTLFDPNIYIINK